MMGMAGFSGWRVEWLSPWLSFPHCGNVLLKPLDSSAFVPDTALPPASMQAGLRRNDEGAVVEHPSRLKQGLTE